MLKSLFNNAVHSVITVVSLVLIAAIILFSNKIGQFELKAGDVSHEDIYAPRSIVDEKTTTARRSAARNSVEDVYVYNDDKRIGAVENITALFDAATTIREKNLSPSEGAKELRQALKINISEKAALTIISSNNFSFSEIKKLSSITDKIMSQNIFDVEDAKKEAASKIDALSVSNKQKDSMKEVFSLVLSPNMELDTEETERRRKSAEEAISEIEYKKNQIIVRKGDVVSEAQLDMLKLLGLIKGTSPVSYTYTVGTILLLVICYTILMFFFLKRKKAQGEIIPILSITALLTVAVSYYGKTFLPGTMIEMLPVGIFPCIAAIFAGAQTSVISTVFLSVICGIAFDANWSHTVCLIIAGTMASYAFSSVKRRSHLLPAAMMTSTFYALTFCAMSFIEVSSVSSAFASFGKGLLCGILSGLITIGSIQFFEWLFNATTPMKLSELTNPENKLLKKLLVDAPGTYHHSLTVANISEIAARSIGADSLLARVGAYYHDIGKIRHPLYFKENQYDINAHDSLSPFESSEIIINHVSDGIDIATKNRLPKIVCDIISQHHGTTSTGYFLLRAKELDPDVDESKFRYKGPVPRTKEAAIVMLADSCEAAVRSIDEKSEAKIEAMVRRIATERVNSGQFSECNLTFSELETVIREITKTFGGYFHERIKYE